MSYDIAQNFGGKKLWSTILILADLLYKIANPAMFFSTKTFWTAIRHSFLPPKFCAIQYYDGLCCLYK